MRARMAMVKSGVVFQKIEVDLKDKPPEMLAISPKATVPVLQTDDGKVIEESLEIMIWALQQNDPLGWLSADEKQTSELITQNDGPFKKALDRYKYPGRYPDEDCSGARGDGVAILEQLNALIVEKGYLCGEQESLADIAIFPFIRQFAHVDREWFYGLEFKPLQNWLMRHLESELFKTIMKKD